MKKLTIFTFLLCLFQLLLFTNLQAQEKLEFLYVAPAGADTLNPEVTVLQTEQPVVINQPDRKRRPPRETISASVGLGRITSKIYFPGGELKGDKAGVEWKVEYNKVYNNGLGFGIQYSGFYKSLIEMTLTYIAPSFIGRIRVSDSIILKYGVGCGLFVYGTSGYRTYTGVGFDTNFGGEWMIAKHIGIGLEVQSILGLLPSQENVNLKENETSGINRINIQFGPRFYF